jgi:uncharacterized protein
VLSRDDIATPARRPGKAHTHIFLNLHAGEIVLHRRFCPDLSNVEGKVDNGHTGAKSAKNGEAEMPSVGSRNEDPVALVIQKRIEEAGSEAYASLLSRIAARLREWPGFRGQEVVPPNPPTQVDWVEIEHFDSAEAALSWIQSGERAALLADFRQYLVGQEDFHLLSDTKGRQGKSASVSISHHVSLEDEASFLEWQHAFQAAEARFAGFLRHRIERPLPGTQDHWFTIVTFDSELNLENWLNSPERASILAAGDKFSQKMTMRRTNYGFDFWFPAVCDPSISNDSIVKQNLLVLLVLYPIVFLWGYFIGGPLLDSRGVPFWLSLFIGNLISTQLMGWLIVPWTFNKFIWWLKTDLSIKWNIAGYVFVILLYGVSMAFCAALLSRT